MGTKNRGTRDPVQDRERFNEYEYKGYTYFKTPDGEDLPKKFLFLGKYAFGAATIIGLIDANASYPIAKTWNDRLYRTTKYIVPMVGMAGAYCVTAYYGTLLRKKDDEVNHILAGLSVGLVHAGATNKLSSGIFIGLFFALVGGFMKYGNMHGINFFEFHPRRHFSSYYQRKFNTSLLEDNIRGNWTRELPEKN